MKLSYFTSLNQAVDCAADELNKFLEEDINRLSWSDETASSMEERARFGEMQSILPLMCAAPSLLEALKGAYHSLDYISDVVLYEEGEPVTALNSDDIEAILMESTANSVEIENAIMNVMRELKRPSPIDLAKKHGLTYA